MLAAQQQESRTVREQGIQNTIRNDLAGECLTFRANVGQGWTGDVERITVRKSVFVQPGDVVIRGARPFSTGLPPGFSDLFGLVRYVVKPQDVGRTIGRFFGLEIKTTKGRATSKQGKFLAAVEHHGGVSGVARSTAEARAIIGLEEQA